MGKIRSLCDNVTNVDAKCRMLNEKKKHESVLVIFCIIPAWGYGTCKLPKMKLKKLQKNVPTAKFIVRG